MGKAKRETAILRKQLGNKDYTINTLKLLNRELTVENETLTRTINEIVRAIIEDVKEGK